MHQGRIEKRLKEDRWREGGRERRMKKGRRGKAG